MPRKGENIYKRKDGRWEGRYLKRTPEGRSCYGYVYAATYRDVRDKLRRAAVLWEGVVPREQGKPLLLASMARRWQDSLAGQVKDSTYVKYHVTLTNHILPQLGQISVEAMSHEVIESFAAGLLRGENGQPLSPRTVSDILSVLRSILRFARRSGASVPCDGSSVRIRRPTAEIRVLTRQEQKQLCLYLYNNRSLRNAGILLSLFAGLRVGEVCALRWEDIDLPGRVLHVRHTMQRIQNLDPEGPRTRVVITAPKSITSTRTIPLTDDLARFLAQLPGEHRGYLLTGEDARFCEPRIMQNHFRKVVEEVGMENANYHALRHTFATRCVELGFDVKSLSELLGHSTVSMTMDRYVHPSLEHKRENLQRLSALIPTAQFPDTVTTR